MPLIKKALSGEIKCEDGCGYDLWAKYHCNVCDKLSCALCALDPTDAENMENTDKYTFFTECFWEESERRRNNQMSVLEVNLCTD